MRTGFRLALAATWLVGAVAVPRGPVEAAATPWEYAEQCASQSGAVLNVQVMVDVSLSLLTTDKADVRKTLVRNWMLNLVSLRNGGAGVRVALATYGTVWTPRFDWTDFDVAAAQRLDTVIDALPRDEYDTDHVGALIEASASLDRESERIRSLGSTPCSLLLWFTDGEYDFDGKSPGFRKQRGLSATTVYSPLPVNKANEEAIKEAGLQLACDRGGVVDQLRRRRTNIAAVALGAGSVDFRLVDEMATGRGFADGDRSGNCDTPVYDGGSFGPPPAPPPPPPPDPCDGGRCTTTAKLATSPLANAAQVELRLDRTSGEPGSIESIRVVSPDGQRLELQTSADEEVQQTLGDTAVSLQPLGATGSVLTLSAGTGESLADGWQLEVERSEPEASLVVNTSLTSDLRPRFVSMPEVRSGAETSLAVELAHSDGTPISPSMASLLKLSVTLAGETTPLVADEAGAFSGTLPSTEFANDQDAVTLVVRTSTDETVTIPAVPIEVPILWPGYPTIRFPDARNGVVRVPRFDAPGSARVAFEVVAPDDGKGCVTLEGTAFSTPAGDVGYSAIDAECVPSGEIQERELVLSVSERREASLCGDVRFRMDGERTAESRISATTVCVTTFRSPSGWNKFFAVLFLLLAVFAPFALLSLINRRVGQLPRRQRLQMVQNTVAVVNSDVRNVNGQLAVLPDDFAREGMDFKLAGRTLVLMQGRVELEMRPGGWRRPLLLLTGPQVHLTTSESNIIVGHGRQVIHSGTAVGSVQVPLALDGVWFLVPSLAGAGGGLASANLVVLRVIGSGSTKDGLAQDVRIALDAEELERFLGSLTRLDSFNEDD